MSAHEFELSLEGDQHSKKNWVAAKAILGLKSMGGLRWMMTIVLRGRWEHTFSRTLSSRIFQILFIKNIRIGKLLLD